MFEPETFVIFPKGLQVLLLRFFHLVSQLGPSGREYSNLSW